MTTAVEQIDVNETERIKEAIMAQLVQGLGEIEPQDQPPVILRAEVHVQGLKALSWLCAQDPGSRGYWSNRDDHFELAGVGRADVITGDSSLDYHELMGMLHNRIASARGNARYLGGMRFSMGGLHEDIWDHFKTYRFILPRFEVVKRNGTTIFACNMLTSEDLNDVQDEFLRVVFPQAGLDQIFEPGLEPILPTPIARHDQPDREGWSSNVEAALDAFTPGEYEKVVLARKSTFELEEPINAAMLLCALKRNTSRSFHFMFQPHPDSAFVGASPERLYRRDGDLIRAEAIAGSRGRGASPAEDQALSSELSASEKDLREHQYVIDGIQNTLNGLCSLLVADEEPSVLKLTRCQHLITTFRGRLREGVKDSDLLENLHPTPAVGGCPTDRALQDIARLENFDRGWYAGPVGWIDKDSAQFVVGIRSSLTQGDRLHVFSGAGIVDGSVPEKEWEELENKISDFVALLGSEDGRVGSAHQ